MSYALSCELTKEPQVSYSTPLLMHPAESKVTKYRKWAYVKKYGITPDSVRWAQEYAELLKLGKARLYNSSIPREVWYSIAASTADSKKAFGLYEYLSNNLNMQ